MGHYDTYGECILPVMRQNHDRADGFGGPWREDLVVRSKIVAVARPETLRHDLLPRFCDAVYLSQAFLL